MKMGKSIYHYCKLDTVIKFILPHKRLRLSPLQNTNDPRENKSFIFAVRFWHNSDLDTIQLKKFNKEISEILRNDCKVLCFSQNHNPYFGYESSRMWAYYGDDHKGLCLELDLDEFLNENESIVNPNLLKEIKYYELDVTEPFDHKKIDYTKMESIGIEKYLKKTFRVEHLDYLYFTKNKEWESEHELRLIHFSDKMTDEYCSIKNSLKNIYLGVDFQNSNLQSITKLCPKTEIFELDFVDFRLSAKPIK